MIDLTNIEFYKNPDDNWKEEKINGRNISIPNDWFQENLGSNNLKIIKSGISKFNGTKKYYATGDVSTNKLLNSFELVEYINRPNRANMEPIQNSIFFAKMKDTIKHLKFKENNKEIILSTGFQGIEVINYNLNYIFYNLNKIEIIKNKLSTGSTQLGINDKITSIISITIPNSLIEQEKIASILETQENLIDSKKELLEKYKKQRKYFQQELLSGRIRMKLNNKSMSEAFELGLIKQTFLNNANEVVEYGGDTITNVNIDIIDKDGFESWLSIDFENKIEFYKNIDFKEEKINRRIVSIPEDWTILLNKSIYERNDKSKTTPKNLLKEGLYPFFNCSETQKYFLDTFLLNKESILLSTGGIAAIHYINGKYSYSTDTLSIQINNEKILTKYYYYFFKNFTKYLDESFQGSGLKHLNKNMFNKLNIFCSSSLLEQTLITEQLIKIDNLIESLEEEIKLEDKKFTYLKQELLSGRIRVN